MDLAEGMVAVVRGLPNASLAVSLMEGGNHYTLIPNAALQTPSSFSVLQSVKPKQVQSTSTDMTSEIIKQGACHTSSQAADGRFASVYKVAHCNVQPTSPPVVLTEFPPQRAELCRGEGNFEVGGIGSGETTYIATRATGFRGVMNWPDRGAVFTPRPHYEPDAFAQSLRRHPPQVIPERSSEMIERLINYTQMKNSSSPVKSRSPVSSTSFDSNHNQGYDRRSCTISLRSQKADSEFSRPMVPDDSPTRDNAKKCYLESGEFRMSPYRRSHDVRESRKVKENVKGAANYPSCPVIEENSDHLKINNKLREILRSVDSKHMETQAEISMISREVTTVPREQPAMRNVAVPSTPSCHSDAECELQIQWSCKSIQTCKPVDLSVYKITSEQICVSSIDITQGNKKKDNSFRKSKSQEELGSKDDLEEQLLQLIKDTNISTKVNTECDTRNELLKKLRKMRNANRSDRVKLKFEKCIGDDKLYSEIDLKNFTKELSNELISKIKANNIFLSNYNSTQVLERDNTGQSKNNNTDSSVDELIKTWLGDIPIKPLDYLGRHVKKEIVLESVTVKLKSLIMNKVNHDCYSSLKPEIFDILEDIPIEVNARNKMYYLNKIVNNLVIQIESICSVSTKDRRRWKRAVNVDLDKPLRSNLRTEYFPYSHVQPTEKELNQFVKEELQNFMTKFNLKICAATQEQIQVELIDILIDSIEAIKFSNDEEVKKEILIMLSDLIVISEHEGTDFVNILTKNLKKLFTDSLLDPKQQNIVVLQNSVQNTSMQTQNSTADASIGAITDHDIQNNLDFYSKQIVQQINEWMTNIKELNKIDASFKQDIAKDLARDIVDRHKYLELNPDSKGTDADELEILKYQIFKWVNKRVASDNLETIEQAPRLMQRIKSLPIPMLTRPIHNVNTNLPLSCKKYCSENNQRRFSSAGEYAFERPSSSKENNNKNFGKQTRASSPGGISIDSAHNADKGPSQNVGVMSSPTQSFPKRVFFTETDMPHIPKTCPWYTSMIIMEPPKEASTFRRSSEPPGFPSGAMKNEATNKSALVNTGNHKETTTTAPITRLNEEFDQYLQNWVQQIPIITSNPEEQALIGKMRLGIYNGVWKVLTKLHMNPSILDNHYYYQDILDDEIEELLDLLPQSKELTDQKQIMKMELIDKTTNMNKQVFNTTASASFKQQLVDNVSNNIPRKALGFAGSDLMTICEEIHKINLAETYIMYTMFRGQDNVVKAKVYKKKLMKQIQELFDTIKRNHGIEVKDIDLKTYKEEIMNALAKVPLPSDDTIREEGDEILIGLEIEQWFSDLPLYPTENRVLELLCRKRYRDALARKVHDMEKQMNLNNCEDELRHEIKRFMGKLPIRENNLENIPFMVEQLVNRLKNRPKDLIEGSGTRNVNFIEPHSYDEFSRNMQLCSSLSDDPGAKRPQINESSYMIVGGERVVNAPYTYVRTNLQNQSHDPEDVEEWVSLFYEPIPPALKQAIQEQSLQNGQALGSQLVTPQQNSGQFVIPQQVSGGQFVAPQQVSGQFVSPPHASGSHFVSPHHASGGQFASPRYASRGQFVSPHHASGGQYVSPHHASGGQFVSPHHASGGQFVSPHHASGGQFVSPHHAAGSQFVCPHQNLGDQIILSGPDVALGRHSQIPRDLSYRQPMPESMQRQESLRHGKSSYTPILPEANLPGSFSGPTTSSNGQGNVDQRSTMTAAPDGMNVTSVGFTDTQGDKGSKCSCPERPPAPTIGLQPENSTRPCETSQGQDRFKSQSPSAFSRQPMGFSTPQENVPPPRESRPKKRTREIDRSRRDAARRRLHLSDSDDSVDEEVKCRCMERICKCRKKRSLRFPYEEFDMDYPYFPMRCPFSYYF